MSAIIIKQKQQQFPIGTILGGLVVTILLILLLLKNSSAFEKRHSYKKGEIVTIHNVDFEYVGTSNIDNGIFEELIRKDFENTLEYKGYIYEYEASYYNDFIDIMHMDRYRKVEEETDEIQWGSSLKTQFLDVDVDFDGRVLGLVN